MAPIHTYIDYSLLKAKSTRAQVIALCETAVKQGYAAVCISPAYVALAMETVAARGPAVCSVIGFPHGLHLPETKLHEAERLSSLGATELDWVINLNQVANQEWGSLEQELQAFQDLCNQRRLVSKVIIESGLLEEKEIEQLCTICTSLGVTFVKTSTGFAGVGAELGKVRLMRNLLPASMQIKASGGIRDYETARAFIEAGATRIGTSTPIVKP